MYLYTNSIKTSMYIIKNKNTLYFLHLIICIFVSFKIKDSIFNVNV